MSASPELRNVKPVTPLPVYITPQQLAKMLQVDERTVLRWAQQDASMPASRFGPRVVRFERGALLRWLERKKPRVARAVAQDRRKTEKQQPNGFDVEQGAIASTGQTERSPKGRAGERGGTR